MSSKKNRIITGARITLASIVFVVPAIATAGTVIGRVVDITGVRALGGAQIRIPALGRTAVSDSDGSFRFADIDAGNYTLVVSYVGTPSIEEEVTVGDGITRSEIRLGTGVDETILVIGQRANLASSLSRQRSSDTVETVLTRDAIGQFPDQNVAETLRRAPGINVLNDQGEGRFVAIRGLDPNLNSASINGSRVPAPESDVRSVALDVLPSELIESIDIKKSLTPDMDGDTIGGSIEINTTSALDRREPFFAATAEGSYNDLSGDWSPKGSFNFSTMLTERFGVAGGLSYYDRIFSTDNIEPDGWGETDAGGVFADEIQYRDYDVERTRFGASLSFDFLASENTRLFARLLHSEFEDQEYRGRLIFEMDEEPSATTGSSAQFLSGDGEIAVLRDIKDRKETQTIKSYVLGGETFAGLWTLNYEVSLSTAEEQERGSLDPTTFERSFEDPGEFGITFDYSRLENPTFSVGAGQALFLDPAEYEFDEVERTTVSNSEDEETAVKFDLSREFILDRGSFALQFGGKARQREKSFDGTIDFFEDAEFTLADVLGNATYGLAPINPLPSGAAVSRFFNANFDQFSRNDVDSDFDSAAEDFLVEEDVTAGYVLGRLDSGRLRIVGGVRYERTENFISGNRVELVEEGAIRDGVPLADDTVFVTPISFDKDYDHWLPSLNIRFEAADDVVLRAAYYDSLMRPNIGNLAPRFLVEEADDGEREGEFGNPDLEPYEASNIDLSAEWYFTDSAVVQGGLFFKDIDNFIAVAVFDDVTFNGIFATEAEIPINGESASVQGFEFAYQQSLTALSPPFDGLLLGINYTYTDAEGTIDGRDIPLPAAAENTFNATIGYQTEKLNLRLAATYRDEYLDEVGGDPLEDRYVKDHLQYDITAKYWITDRVQLFAEFINLGDEPYVAFQRGPGRDRLLQYEEYSWTSKIGVSARF